MIEILFICLIIWIIYAWRTGKFSKEYQDKNNAELKKAWKELKETFTQNNSKISETDKKRNLQAQKDYEYTLKLRNKTIHSDSDSRSYDLEDELPVISLYRYVIEYKDGKGNNTIRGIDITAVHKHPNNNRWYFLANTDSGNRTFKSQRVIQLKDQWCNQIYKTSQSIREHLLSEYDVIEDNFFDD
ncbi:hypothetical protein N5B96_12170 [Acinetobacter johnsonii]|uniref:hypothetical protein n=1 Tax=Acinetobacter johnsonii TaxID=40214 RepID=UPI002448DB98|nr:hypothetical protein [Acinetobacter johnsonii]MDH1070222.1 hypothetical protein [Acinetobacter johnsonii]